MKISHEALKKTLQERLLNRSRRMQSFRLEMEALLSAHVRYQDLEEALAQESHSASILIGLLGRAGVAETLAVAENVSDEHPSCLEQTLSERGPAEELRDNLRLWRAVREIVRLGGESSVGEIQGSLVSLGMDNVTRQAIESALRQHRKEFSVSKRGRELYVDLK
jgi:hypothetical protein